MRASSSQVHGQNPGSPRVQESRVTKERGIARVVSTEDCSSGTSTLFRNMGLSGIIIIIIIIIIYYYYYFTRGIILCNPLGFKNEG